MNTKLRNVIGGSVLSAAVLLFAWKLGINDMSAIAISVLVFIGVIILVPSKDG